MGNIIEREFGIKYRGILAEITNFPDIQNRINKTGLNSNQQKILDDIFDYIKNPGLDSPAIRANDIFTTLTSPVPDVNEVNDLLKQIQDIGVSIKKEQDLKKAQSAQPPAPNPVGSTSTPVKQPVIPTQPIQAPPPIIVRPKTPPLTQQSPPQSTVTPPATPTTIDELSKQEQYYQKLLATYKASETPDFKMEREILAVEVQLTKIQKRKIKIQIQDLEQSAVPDKNSQIKLLKEKLDFLKTDHMIATIKLSLLTNTPIKMKDRKTTERTYDDQEVVIQEVGDRIKYYQSLKDKMIPIIPTVPNNPEELEKQQKVAAVIAELSGLQPRLIEKFEMQSTSTTHASHDPASHASNSTGQDKKAPTLSATIQGKDSGSKHSIGDSTFTATVSGDPKSTQRSGPKTDDASNQAQTSRDAATLAAQQALIDKGILNKDYIYYLQQNADKDVKNKTQSGDEVTFGGLEKRINDNETRREKLDKLKSIKGGKRLAQALEYSDIVKKDEQKLDAKVEIYDNAKVEKESDDKLTVTLNNPKGSTKSSNSYTVVKDDKDLTMTTKDPLSSISDEMIVQMIETAKRTVGNQTIVISNLFHDKQSPAEKDDAEKIAQKIEGYSSAMGMRCKIEDNGLREQQHVSQANRGGKGMSR